MDQVSLSSKIPTSNNEDKVSKSPNPMLDLHSNRTLQLNLNKTSKTKRQGISRLKRVDKKRRSRPLQVLYQLKRLKGMANLGQDDLWKTSENCSSWMQITLKLRILTRIIVTSCSEKSNQKLFIEERNN